MPQLQRARQDDRRQLRGAPLWRVVEGGRRRRCALCKSFSGNGRVPVEVSRIEMDRRVLTDV